MMMIYSKDNSNVYFVFQLGSVGVVVFFCLSLRLSSQVHVKRHKLGEGSKGKQNTSIRCFFPGSGFDSMVDFKTKFISIEILATRLLGRSSRK